MRCLFEWSVSPQLFGCLERRCLCEWFVSPQLFGRCRGGVRVSDLRRRSYLDVCNGSVCVSALCCRSYNGVCRGAVQECFRRVSSKSVPTTVLRKSVKPESYKSFTRVSCTSVLQRCFTRVPCNIVSCKIVSEDCQVKVSYKSFGLGNLDILVINMTQRGFRMQDAGWKWLFGAVLLVNLGWSDRSIPCPVGSLDGQDFCVLFRQPAKAQNHWRSPAQDQAPSLPSTGKVHWKSWECSCCNLPCARRCRGLCEPSTGKRLDLPCVCARPGIWFCSSGQSAWWAISSWMFFSWVTKRVRTVSSKEIQETHFFPILRPHVVVRVRLLF